MRRMRWVAPFDPVANNATNYIADLVVMASTVPETSQLSFKT
jgi:hypothetical protein